MINTNINISIDTDSDFKYKLAYKLLNKKVTVILLSKIISIF